MSIKTGIIGAGSMLQYHVAGIRKGGGTPVAIADLNESAAQAAAKKYGIPHVFDDPGKMLAAITDLDAVAIIVPNKFHKPLAIQALEAGKHVFCEKPPALNAPEVEEMIAAAEAAGKTLMFNFNNRARPESVQIMNYIKAGEAGEIQTAQSKWIRRTGIPGFGGWFTQKDMAGGGATIDLLHMVDLAMYFMGYPEPAYVLGNTFDTFSHDKNFKGPWGIPDVEGGKTDVECAAHALATFKTGQVLTIQVSWAEMVKREEVSVVFQGTRAGGKVERLFGVDGFDETATDSGELYVQEHGMSVNRQLVADPCEDMGRINSMANFIDVLEGRAEPLSTMKEGLKLMKVIDALYESARTGKPVEA